MKISTMRFTLIVLFAAVIAAGCFIAVPLAGGVPIVLQNMFVVLASLILGGAGGFLSVLIFVVAGALGLPIFSGGSGGIAHLLGPTGGFIIGYLPAALAAGLVAGKPRVGENVNKTTGKKFNAALFARLALAALAGFVILYVPGVLWFMRVTGRDISATMAACVVPFIPGDLIKLIITVPLAARLRVVAARYLDAA